MGFKSRAVQPPPTDPRLAQILATSLANRIDLAAHQTAYANGFMNAFGNAALGYNGGGGGAGSSLGQYNQANSLTYAAGLQAYRPTSHARITEGEVTDAHFEPVIPRNRTSVIASMGFGGRAPAFTLRAA